MQALGHNLGVWVLIGFPYGLFGWLGLLRTRRVVLGLGLGYGVVLMLSSALVFSVPTLAGLFYHSAGAVLPWLAVGAALVISSLAKRRRSLAFGLGVATAALVIAQCAVAWPRAVEDSLRNARTFQSAADWIAIHAAPGEPVIATQAHSLNYASGQPAMSLPAGQDVASVKELAGFFGARYVVLTERVRALPGRAGRAPWRWDRASPTIHRSFSSTRSWHHEGWHADQTAGTEVEDEAQCLTPPGCARRGRR